VTVAFNARPRLAPNDGLGAPCANDAVARPVESKRLETAGAAVGAAVRIEEVIVIVGVDGALLDVASALVAGGTTLRLRDLRDRIHEATELVRHRPGAAGSTPPEASEPHPGVERRERLLALFREHQGNVSRVAAELGTPRAQVYCWLRAAGLEASELRARKA
jgi:hypothetical protein